MSASAMFDPHWAPFGFKKVSGSMSGPIGSELGVVIGEEGLLLNGAEDSAPILLLRRHSGAEGGLFRGQIAALASWF